MEKTDANAEIVFIPRSLGAAAAGSIDNTVETAETEDLTLVEELTKADNEENEVASEESSTQEKPAEEKDDETSTLEDLDKDEDFQEAKKELETEMGGNELTFNQTKKFRKTYWEAKESQRENLKLQDQLTELQDKKLSDNELLGETVKRGLLEQDAPPAKTDEFTKEKFEQIYSKATPEQREWLDTIKNMQTLQNKPLLEQLDKYKEKFGEITTQQQERDIANEETTLREEIKEKYDLDYDKDVIPKVKELIPSLLKNIPSTMTLRDAGWTPKLLANQVIALHGIKLAEKKVVKDTKKLNEVKKKANVETDSVKPVAEPLNDENKEFEDIIKEEFEKAGLAKFQ